MLMKLGRKKSENVSIIIQTNYDLKKKNSIVNFTNLGSVDAFDLYFSFQVMMISSREDLNIEGTWRILNDCCLTVETGAHHLLT